MIDSEKLNTILAEYKNAFVPSLWEKEKYKWEAIKHFQEHWDISAPDFLNMFLLATEKTGNLLASSNNFPRNMVKAFAEVDAEGVREMFVHLFDETRDFVERIEKFQSDAKMLQNKYDDGTWEQHYQNPNSISTYLWLRYPDKYYIYKYSVCRSVAKVLGSDFIPEKGASSANLQGGFNLYNEISEQLKKDEELVNILKGVLTDDCYPDKELRTLTIDFCFYISSLNPQENATDDTEWFPVDYDPKITTEKWLTLLADGSVFTETSLKIMRRIKDIGGAATCTQLSEKYGESVNYYNVGSSSLAKRVAIATGCPVMSTNTENAKWWPILYVGRKTDKDQAGSYIWKLRNELGRALEQFNFSGISLYANASMSAHGYWWLNASPNIWSLTNMGLGEIESYTLYNKNGNKRRIFQNFLDARAGDTIIGYESNPVKKIVAIAEVTENDAKNLYFEKIEALSTPIDYATLKDCPELEQMEYFNSYQGSLFKLTRDEYDFIMDLIRKYNPITRGGNEKYSKGSFLEEVYITGEHYDTLVSLLKNKRNLILQGAPGVGKTFAAKRLAYAIMGEKDDDRVEFIQFHQNYSYEDFIVGYKPADEGFRLEEGIFTRFCRKAADRRDKEFFFIIDEINRGNMSKIFGEALMSIEKDYRGREIPLSHKDKKLTVPENLYIIGMMNTADRSIAMIDYALRRRFSFFEMEPGFDSDGFKAYRVGFGNKFDALIDNIKILNKEITDDSSLGEGFRIGHSYFCGRKECTDEWMEEVVKYDILPTLKEYWFDESPKYQHWQKKLCGIL